MLQGIEWTVQILTWVDEYLGIQYYQFSACHVQIIDIYVDDNIILLLFVENENENENDD